MGSKIFDIDAAFVVSTATKKMLVVIDEYTDESDVLLQLCQNIVSIEDKGYLVSGVTRIMSDGTRPRVSFRNSKEYSAAKRRTHASFDDLSGKYLKLAKDLKAAYEYGKAHMGTDDGGTCNFDSPTLYLPRWNKEKVKAAVKAAGLNSFEWEPSCGHEAFLVVSVPCAGQGNTRTNAAEAMSKRLGELGYDSGMYYQMD